MNTIAPDLFDERRDQLSAARAFLRRALRAWRTAFSVLFIGCLACLAFLLLRHPAFRSETVLLYSAAGKLGEDSDRLEPTRSVTARLKEILMSRASLDGLVQKFDLYPEIRRARGPVDAAEELRKHIEFRASGGDTFSIAFTGTSATEAQAVTARLAEMVIEQDSDLRRKQAATVRDFLESERSSTEQGLKDAELALASFIAAHPRFALDATPLATGAAIRASLGAPAQAQASAPGGVRTGLLSGVPRVPSIVVEGADQSSSTESRAGRETVAERARAKAALAAARANLTDLAARFTPMHPDVRAAQADVERATVRLAAADAAAASGERSSSAEGTPRPAAASPPPGAVPSAGGAVVAKRSGADTSHSERDVVTLETEWVRLTRLATEARQHQDQIEAALFKANIATSSEKGDGFEVAVIDPAFLPETAVPPGRAAIAAMFAAVSVLLALMGAALRALVDDHVYDESDLRELGPVLALVPQKASV